MANRNSEHPYISREKTSRDKLIIAVELGVLAAGAMQLMKHREDAEDLLQDTYERALRGLNNFRGDSEVKTWMTRIMRNRAYDKLDLASRKEELVDPDLMVGTAITGLETVLPGDAAETREELALIGQLKETEQKVVIMLTAGYTNEEVAKGLGMPTGTVKSIYSRARTKLINMRDAA